MAAAVGGQPLLVGPGRSDPIAWRSSAITKLHCPDWVTSSSQHEHVGDGNGQGTNGVSVCDIAFGEMPAMG